MYLHTSWDYSQFTCLYTNTICWCEIYPWVAISCRSGQYTNLHKIHTPTVKGFLKNHFQGCMDFKWRSTFWFNSSIGKFHVPWNPDPKKWGHIRNSCLMSSHLQHLWSVCALIRIVEQLFHSSHQVGQSGYLFWLRPCHLLGWCNHMHCELKWNKTNDLNPSLDRFPAL